MGIEKPSSEQQTLPAPSSGTAAESPQAVAVTTASRTPHASVVSPGPTLDTPFNGVLQPVDPSVINQGSLLEQAGANMDDDPLPVPQQRVSRKRIFGLSLLVFVLLVVALLGSRTELNKRKAQEASVVSASQHFKSQTTSLPDLGKQLHASSSPSLETLTVNGNLNTTHSLTLGSPLTVANGGTGVGTLPTDGVLIGNGTSMVSGIVADSANLCLVSTGGAPKFQSCPDAGGVISFDALNGAITLANSTGSAGNITINNAKADGTTKGIAAFNSKDFVDNGSGIIDTVQGIATTSSPTFANLTVSSTLNTNNLVPNNALAIGAASQAFTLQGNGSSVITTTNGSDTTTIGFTGVHTGNVTYDFDRSATAGTYAICTTVGNCAGTGGGITGSGTTNQLAVFTGSGTIGSSDITDVSGSSVSIASGVSLTAQGSANFENATNSTTAFQIQNASGTSLLNVDTSGGNVGLGLATSPSPLGYTTVGGSTGTGYQNNINANKFTATQTGVVSSMSVYIPSPGSGFHYQLAIYSNSGSVPGSYIASTASAALTSGWNTANLTTTPTLTAGTTYWLVYWTDVSNGTNAGIAFNQPIAGSDFYYYSGGSNYYGSGSSNGMPTNFPAGSDAGSYQHSIYVSYVAGTGYAVNVSSSGNLSATGSALFEDSSNSTNAFQIQTSSGSNVLTADTANSRVLIGNGAANVAGEALTVETSNGSYGEMITDGTTSVGVGINNSSGDGIGTYSDSTFGIFTDGSATGGTTAETINTNGSAEFQNYTNTATAFQVQNASGGNELNVDHARRRHHAGQYKYAPCRAELEYGRVKQDDTVRCAECHWRPDDARHKYPVDFIYRFIGIGRRRDRLELCKCVHR